MEEKKYYTISEISRAAGVPEHSIRYWERRFQLLRPVRKESGHRRYTARDLELLSEIKDMVYRRKMTLAGAKKALSRAGGQEPRDAAAGRETLRLLTEIRKELEDIANS
ncbi:MAG: MerR family transcriptional regulator [Elusimicrobiales bacterium]